MLDRLNLRVVFIAGDRPNDVRWIMGKLKSSGIRVESDWYFDPQELVSSR